MTTSTPRAALLALAVALPLASGGASAAEASAQMIDSQGERIGTVDFTPTPSGKMEIVFNLVSIPQGVHGVHVHQVGRCDPPGFASAGEHVSGSKEHGIISDNGPHPGDLPNAYVDADGRLHAAFFNDALSIDGDGPGAMLDADGAAVIVHSKADDYASQPGGASGNRIACGVIEPTRTRE